MFESMIVSVIAGVVTLAAALVSQVFARRLRKEKAIELASLEKVVSAVGTEEASRKAAVLERVVERIPVGLTAEQFESLLAEIASRLPSAQAERTPASGAVESLITNYHEQALGQAKAQFWFSIAAATIGFVWILWAGAAIDPQALATVSKTLPGIVMDAVAFLFFRQASETRQRATELYDRLRRDKQMAESATIVASIEDLRLRGAVKAQLALHMAGLQPDAIDLSSFLSRDGSGASARKERMSSNPPIQPTGSAGC